MKQVVNPDREGFWVYVSTRFFQQKSNWWRRDIFQNLSLIIQQCGNCTSVINWAVGSSKWLQVWFAGIDDSTCILKGSSGKQSTSIAEQLFTNYGRWEKSVRLAFTHVETCELFKWNEMKADKKGQCWRLNTVKWRTWLKTNATCIIGWRVWRLLLWARLSLATSSMKAFSDLRKLLLVYFSPWKQNGCCFTLLPLI